MSKAKEMFLGKPDEKDVVAPPEYGAKLIQKQEHEGIEDVSQRKHVTKEAEVIEEKVVEKKSPRHRHSGEKKKHHKHKHVHIKTERKSSEEELPVHEEIRNFLSLLQKRDALAGGLNEKERQLGEKAQTLVEHQMEMIQLLEQEREARLRERELRQQQEEKFRLIEEELIEMKKRDKELSRKLKQKQNEIEQEKLLSEARDRELFELDEKRKRLEEDLLAVRNTQKELELEVASKNEQIELRRKHEAQLHDVRQKAMMMENDITQISTKYRDLLEQYEKERDAKHREREERIRKEEELERERVKMAEVESKKRKQFNAEFARMIEKRRELEDHFAFAQQKLKELEAESRIKDKEMAELGDARGKVKSLKMELEQVETKFGELEARAERERKKKEEERERRIEREKALRAMEEQVVESERMHQERLLAERKRYKEAIRLVEEKEYEGMKAKEKFHEVAEKTEQIKQELKELGLKSKEFERDEQRKLEKSGTHKLKVEKEYVELEGKEQGHKHHH